MVTIIEIDLTLAIGFAGERRQNLLPNPPPLILQQPPMAGCGRGGNVMRQIFPRAPRPHDIQNPIDDFAVIDPGPSRGRGGGQQPFDAIPLRIGQIGAIGFAR